MRELQADVTERDLAKQPLTEAELDALIGKRDHLPFLNPRNELYRERGFKENPPGRKEAIELLAREVNLLRRPLLAVGEERVFGFDEEAYRRLLGS